MGRFYGTRVEGVSPDFRYFVNVDLDSGTSEVEVTKTIFDAIDEMQKEHWRTEKNEARHTYHLETMYDQLLSRHCSAQNPEQILIEQLEATQIQKALHQMPVIQQKRFLLRHYIGLTVKQIASLEGCTERAVNYSLMIARTNLQEILSAQIK